MQNLPSAQTLLAPNRMTDHARREHEYLMLVAIFAMLWLALTFLGCAKNTQTSNTVDSMAATPPAGATSTAAPAPAKLTDGNILAALDEGDSAEIALAKLALVKSKNPKVKSFAKMMIADHGKMKHEKEELAKKLGITRQPPANDAEPAHLTAEMSALNAASTPIAFDSIYIGQAVADHTDVLAVVKDFESKAQAPELKNAIAKAEPIVQKHLDMATALQSGRANMKRVAMEKKKQ